MSVKYYKINGVWNTYSYWHYHYGYTTVPSNAVGFKSCAYSTFGQDVDPGYYIEGSIPGFLNWSMWASNSEYAWYNTQMMAVQNHRYPSVAESVEMTDGTVTSPAAMYDDDGSIYYLIRDDMADGWLTEEEATERGWSIEVSGDRVGGIISDTKDTSIRMADFGGFIEADYGVLFGMEWNIGGIVSLVVPIEMPNSLIVVDETSGNILLQNGSEYLTNPWSYKLFENDEYIVVERQLTVTVYDTSNNDYTAFVKTIGGTDYYYVLDGVQTDWTDDLKSIGYYLGPTITLYMASGNKYINSNITNNTGVTSGYMVYSDSGTTTPYYWDYTKRIELGYYTEIPDKKWIVSSIQTQADMPSTTGASLYLTCPYGYSSIYFGRNDSGSSYYTMTVIQDWFRIYDDAITVWVDQDHLNHSVTGTQTYISDVDWDDSVTYKVLYFLQVDSQTNPTGVSVSTNRLHYVSFENSGGKVAVKLTLGSISITIAKIVFYAKKASI